MGQEAEEEIWCRLAVEQEAEEEIRRGLAVEEKAEEIRPWLDSQTQSRRC